MVAILSSGGILRIHGRVDRFPVAHRLTVVVVSHILRHLRPFSLYGPKTNEHAPIRLMIESLPYCTRPADTKRYIFKTRGRTEVLHYEGFQVQRIVVQHFSAALCAGSRRRVEPKIGLRSSAVRSESALERALSGSIRQEARRVRGMCDRSTHGTAARTASRCRG